MTKEQSKFLKKTLGNVGGDFSNVLMQLLNPQEQGQQFEDQFQKGVVQPTMQTYQQDILPSLEQRYSDVGAGSSSALNQALTRSSEDLTNLLAGQRIGYQGQQQQYGLQNQQLRQQAQQGALQQIMNLVGQRAYQPIVQGPTEGLIKPLIGAGGQAAAASILASSRLVKDNIRDYDKSLDVLDTMKVKQYDYTIEVPGEQKDRVGLIAEELPGEITVVQDGVLSVDLYGLVSILVNCVKDLNANMKQLQEKINVLEGV